MGYQRVSRTLQGECGSCYAFSAIAALESQILLKYGVSIDLAEQAILDCAPLKYCSNTHTATSHPKFEFPQ